MRGRTLPLLLWLALLAGGALVVARARFTADMSAFLPAHPTAEQRLLVDELRDGMASRLILVAIDGGDAAARARASIELARQLGASPAFVSVANGAGPAPAADKALVFQNRYLLSDQVSASRFTVAGLRRAIGESIESLASATGFLANDLLLPDPTGETLAALEQLIPRNAPRSEGGAWVSRDGSEAVLVARTRAAGSDTDAQERTIGLIRSTFESIRAREAGLHALELRMTGPGAFAVSARATIIQQVVRLSVLSSVLITVLLAVVYRSLGTVLLGLLPVASGALAGTAAVALGFGVVHGITLGFGVTLIGESVDYSIYLLIQARRGSEGRATDAWIRSLWPTVRLGLLTSLCGFASLLPSGFPGLAQLGLYSMAGLVSAALVTRFVLPVLLPEQWVARPVTAIGGRIARVLAALRRYRRLLWLIPLAAGVIVFVRRDRVWNRDLAALSPVSLADQALDGRLRGSLGAPDVRDLIVISAPDAQGALAAAEGVGQRLDALVDAGELAGFETPARYLPSLARQRERRAALPEAAELRARLLEAVAPLPIQAARLEPFVTAAEQARTAPLLDRAALAGTSLGAGLDALLVERAGRAVALMPLSAPGAGPHASSIDTDRVRAALGTAPPGVSVLVIDLKHESDALYANYLAEAIRLSALGFVAILVLLLVALRSVPRTLRVVAPLVMAVLVVIALLVGTGHSLTILHLIGLLLIVAVGSNYALFFDRRHAASDAAERATMLASLFVANLATVLGFGILALSSVPVLAALGTTVAPGALAALIFSALMAKSPEQA